MLPSSVAAAIRNIAITAVESAKQGIIAAWQPVTELASAATTAVKERATISTLTSAIVHAHTFATAIEEPVTRIVVVAA